MPLPRPPQGSWAGSDRPLVRTFLRPLRDFLDTERAGGILLLAATLIALAWASSPWRSSYHDLWHVSLTLDVGGLRLAHDLRGWVDDGLMTIFFFVVGLEIKRELVTGELSERRRALLPAAAAVGGMALPALAYLAINVGTPAARGWGVPMATDIAFAMGALGLFGRGLPSSLRVFLLSLAIVDDIGAIVVIALFYSGHVDVIALVVAAGLFGVVVAMRQARIWWTPAYIVVGVAAWIATAQSGIHPTIAGVGLGLLAPARPIGHREEPLPRLTGLSPAAVRERILTVNTMVPVVERLEYALHPWTSYVIVPLFALANAGIDLSGNALVASMSSPVALGIVVGLVCGKVVGVTGATLAAARLGVAPLPEGSTPRDVASLGGFAGIGFTVSLFVAGIAFTTASTLREAKIGIVAGSVLATVIGTALARRSPRPSEDA